jgi:hypothetical protein
MSFGALSIATPLLPLFLTPFADNLPCPVLQSDDTLIFLRCSPTAILAIKQILQVSSEIVGKHFPSQH